MRLSLRLARHLAVVGLIPLALSACKKEEKAAEATTAQGEVLPGSASDAMLPLDSVRSQPPLAPQDVASGKPGAGSGRHGTADALPDATEDAGPPSPGAAPSLPADPAAAQ